MRVRVLYVVSGSRGQQPVVCGNPQNHNGLSSPPECGVQGGASTPVRGVVNAGGVSTATATRKPEHERVHKRSARSGAGWLGNWHQRVLSVVKLPPR